MLIQFSPELIKYMAIYLGIPLQDFALSKLIPYSRSYFYKILDNTLNINVDFNIALNAVWNQYELTIEDLNNIYEIIDLAKIGLQKEKAFKLKQAKEAIRNRNLQGGNYNESKK